jgi:hypothetical protein
MVQAGRSQLLRGFNANLRMVQHGDTRVMYYDPNAAKLSLAGATVENLLRPYLRFQV